ncbi:PEP-CTERM sorting domain-containing protein [Candidatus Pacearchaeota archaeon]|nr:PEP-CTERM sorting domain-containing protein [Candidatus Pacearchaeota archaeon]
MKKLAAIVGAGIFALLPNKLEADGNLKIENYVRGNNTYVQIVNKNSAGVIDRFDSKDIDLFEPRTGESGIYSDIGFIDPLAPRLTRDWRTNESTTPFNIELIYNGNISEPTENYLEFWFPNFPNLVFDHMENMSLRQTDISGNVISGREWDVFDVISNNSGRIDLDDLPVGGYSPAVPYAHFVLDFEPIDVTPLVHTLNIDVYRNGVKGDKSFTLTYGEDGATDARNDVGLDVDFGKPRMFSDTLLGEFGVYTRPGAFEQPVLVRDARSNGGDGNVLIEGYHHSEKGHFPEVDNWKLVFDTNDPSYFKNFSIVQRAPNTFFKDSRYDGVDSSTPALSQEEPYNTLDDIINESGHGELEFISQGTLWRDEFEFDMIPGAIFDFGVAEVDTDKGPAFSFDLFPDGGSPYEYTENMFYVGEGMSANIHTKTPEPGTLGMLVGAGLVGGYALLRRRKKK